MEKKEVGKTKENNREVKDIQNEEGKKGEQ